MENINKYQSELLELNVKDKKSDTELKNAHLSSLGIYSSFPGVSSIKSEYFDRKAQLENQIKNECFKAISKIANSIAEVKVEIPLIDYNVPFEFVEDFGMNAIQITGEDKIYFYFLTKEFSAFQELESIILTEGGFFNQADVILKSGKAPYLMTIKNAKHKLKYYNLIEKNGSTTALGRGVKDNFKIMLESGEKMPNEIDGKFSIDELIILLFKTPGQKDRKDWIEAFDVESKLEGNLKLLSDTHLKWLESIGY